MDKSTKVKMACPVLWNVSRERLAQIPLQEVRLRGECSCHDVQRWKCGEAMADEAMIGKG